MRESFDSIQRGADVLDQLNAGRPLSDETSMLRMEGVEAQAVISTAVSSKAKTPISVLDDQGHKKAQATILLELCASVELFHDGDRNGYAVINPGHREVWPIESKSFKNWLEHQYYTQIGKAVSKDAIGDALGALEAKARYECPKRQVFLRVAWLVDRIYIDLADEAWRVVEIDASGWRILDTSPVMFIRSAGMQALPEPVNGDLCDLAKTLNILPGDLPLVIGFVLMAARGCGPYPILVVQGEQGSGKSTFTKRIRNLIDPSSVPLRGLTNDTRDLMVTATNNHMIVLDNLSGLSAKLSDDLCRMATGGGFAERKLYTNREEVLIEIQRPIILNGIDEIATRSDLMDRALVVHLPVIPDTARIDEAIGHKLYEELRPGLLGGLYSALSHALCELPNTRLARKPRMADFAVWATAAEGELGWPSGTILTSYWRHQQAAMETMLDASPIAEILIRFMEGRDRWSGTATELLEKLGHKATVHATRSPIWPKTAQALVNALKRAAGLLRHHEIMIEKGMRAGRKGNRIMVITNGTKLSSALSASSEPSDGLVPFADNAPTRLSALPGVDVNVASAGRPSPDAASDNADGADSAFPSSTANGEVEIEI